MEEALGELRSSLEPQLQLASLQARGRALGEFHLFSELKVGIQSWTDTKFKHVNVICAL